MRVLGSLPGLFLRVALVAAVTSLLTAGACSTPPDEELDAGVDITTTSFQVIAMAGPDLEVLEGSRVRLTAHGSRALDGVVSLVWSQTDGPSVLLSDPTSPGPVFVAPLAPATLRFRLRATRGEEASFDDVVVRVRDVEGRRPILLDVPGDTTAAPGEVRTFPLTVVSGDEGALTVSATATCGDAEPQVLDVEAGLITVVVGDALPCVVRAWGVTADGRRSPRVARVFWPHETAIAGETRALAPVLVAPGDPFAVTVDDDPLGLDEGSTTLFVVDGDAQLELASRDERARLGVVAPRRAGPIHLAAERRRGQSSGGVRFLVVDVSSGEANRSPTVSAGPDRMTRPGGTFGLQVSTSDFDGDAVSVTIAQVLGATAVTDDVVPSLFTAPAATGVLLFHVTASDGTSESAPESVRVVVAEDVENQPPTLVVDEALWVTPGSTFVIDASDTTDPDSGFVARVSITQDTSDDVIVLDAPVDATVLALTAGAAGDVYRFRVTAFDDGGLSASRDVTVTVEDAGPYVDALRGSDTTGNGTAALPFASLGAALPVAARHRMPALRLAAGPQLPYVGEDAAGSLIIGGHVYADGAYTEASSRSTLPLGADGLTLAAGGLARVDIVVDVPDTSLVVAGAIAVEESSVVAGAAHAGPLVVMNADASATLSSVSLIGSGAADGVVVDVRPGAALRLVDTVIEGGDGGARVGILCSDAAVDVIGSSVRGGTGTEVRGLVADGCDIALLGALIVGGAGDRCVALEATSTSLVTNAAASLTACDGDATEGVALSLGGTLASTHVEGLVQVAPPGVTVIDALGIDVSQPRVEIENASITVDGVASATLARVAADRFRLVASTATVSAPDGSGALLDLVSAADLVVSSSALTLSASDGALVRASEGTLVRPSMEHAALVGVVSGAASGVDFDDALAGILRDVTVMLTAGEIGDGHAAVELDRVDVDGLSIELDAPGDPVALRVENATTIPLIDRVSIRATSIDGGPTGIVLDGEAEVRSTCVVVNGPGTARSVLVRAPALLRHVTIVSSAVGLALEAGASSTRLANSVVVASAAVARGDGAATMNVLAGTVLDADTLYFDDDITLRREDDVAAIPGAGLSNTSSVVSDDLDPTGRLIAPAPSIVDTALASWSVSSDVDGDARPAGLADRGCDEWIDP